MSTMTTHDEHADHDALLTIENLSISAPAVRTNADVSQRCALVRRINLAIRPGRMSALVGPSGSGKSMTALAIMGLLPDGIRVDEGSITLDRVNLVNASPRVMRLKRGVQIGMIFQEPMTALNPVMTIGAQLEEALQLHHRHSRKAARAAVINALEEVGINDAVQRCNAYPHEFSGGMRQRVLIAMALICKPRVLLADEPTTALDVTVQRQIMEILDRLKRTRRIGILFITHDLGLMADHADDVAVMHDGRIVEQGEAAGVMHRPQHHVTQTLLRCTPILGHRQPRLATVDFEDDK